MLNEYLVQKIEDFEPIIKTIIEDINNLNVVIYLCGDLGSGKTTFTKELVAYLGIKSNITSPTFTIINEYSNEQHDVFHLDLYRLNNISELNELELGALTHPRTGKNNLVIIEWADLYFNELKNIFKDFRPIYINFEHDLDNEQSRLVRIHKE